ncbi:Tn3 family transposase [Xenorhabdus bovienii]|uniref:Tn3 family transposase n=1 Tax=Xenorhabdus bovienii TaxID=40576 RepID=A0AAJ1N1F7_XENBV|nr:Tn3 family transposase [Xenorhabdus bovienii]MDE1487830.1 Tn3 family transposase [Xenorhabdus bovienii]MDE1491760.1 Tn3 family transposase [Xenorhabdus bovienii]MDE1495528.1 Tn3 family transposase [Xenorhabdus bovienii]MDE9473897.1 Tn3 family transposase [Xenorhabdus bovienii]
MFEIRVVCRINILKFRYSTKYFRKGKDVSAMTLVSSYMPINTTVISPNEYEGHLFLWRERYLQ